MKPLNVKETRQKEVQKLLKRQRNIWKLMRELGYFKLKNPIRHGWYKEIVITENVERYKNKNAILEIHDKIEKFYWGKTKEEANKTWLNQTSKYLIYKEFPTLSKKQFNKLSFKAQKMCTSFQYKNEHKKIKIRFYVRIPKGSYKIKYTRAYITHRKRIDPLLESEKDFITQLLNSTKYYNIKASLNPWKDYWTANENKKRTLKIKRGLLELKKHKLEDILNEKTQWEIRK